MHCCCLLHVLITIRFGHLTDSDSNIQYFYSSICNTGNTYIDNNLIPIAVIALIRPNRYISLALEGIFLHQHSDSMYEKILIITLFWLSLYHHFGASASLNTDWLSGDFLSQSMYATALWNGPIGLQRAFTSDALIANAWSSNVCAMLVKPWCSSRLAALLRDKWRWEVGAELSAWRRHWRAWLPLPLARQNSAASLWTCQRGTLSYISKQIC